SILYLITAFQKAGGYSRFHGAATYYILRVDAFSLPWMSPWLYLNPFIVTLSTYGTILFEASYPYLILNRNTRLVAVTSAIAFHAAIATLMGLVQFSAIMIAFQS